MEYYKHTTQTPNILLDHHLKTLTGSELKVILVIIRRTIGMVDKHHPDKRLQQAWISQKLFMLITGLSNRAVSHAIDSLIGKGLILVSNDNGSVLPSRASRMAASRLYYALSPCVLVGKQAPTSDLKDHISVKKGHTIKLSRD
jgi:hypothetical protein